LDPFYSIGRAEPGSTLIPRIGRVGLRRRYALRLAHFSTPTRMVRRMRIKPMGRDHAGSSSSLFAVMLACELNEAERTLMRGFTTVRTTPRATACARPLTARSLSERLGLDLFVSGPGD
jgi:hypothetical protein